MEEFLMANLVDRPVQVHITDGSVFSGMFYSASIETAHGIMLKNARLIKNGTKVASDGKSFQGVQKFLEIGADDLVKIVKTGVTGTEAGSSLESAAPSDCIEDTSKRGEQINESRIIGDDSSERERDGSSSQCVFNNP